MLLQSRTLQRRALASLASTSASRSTSSVIPPLLQVKQTKPQQQEISQALQWSSDVWFAAPQEADFCTVFQNDREQPPSHLPDFLGQAMRSHRPCVVTNLDHQIVHVNPAWQALCGYTQTEVLYKTMSIIQGPQTNADLIQATLSKLQSEDAADMYIVNYKKDGSPFKNHVQLKKICLSETAKDVPLLLGVLEQVDTVPLKLPEAAA